MSSTSWIPRPVDIAFALQIITTVRHGGVWAVPMNRALYTLDHQAKQLKLTVGPVDDIFAKNKVVFGMHGYSVVDARPTTEIALEV